MDIVFRIARILLCIAAGFCINFFIIQPLQARKLRREIEAQENSRCT